MKTITTPAELKAAVSAGVLTELHNSRHQGYVSRKGRVKPYAGKFGAGYTHDTPRWHSTRCFTRTYYIAR